MPSSAWRRAVAGALAVAGLRVGVGLLLAVAPRRVLGRRASQGAAAATLTLVARSLGIRDIVIGVGTAAAARHARPGDAGDLARWVAAGTASDALDALAGATGAGIVGPARAALAAGIPLPVLAADLWTLAELAGAQAARTAATTSANLASWAGSAGGESSTPRASRP